MAVHIQYHKNKVQGSALFKLCCGNGLMFTSDNVLYHSLLGIGRTKMHHERGLKNTIIFRLTEVVFITTHAIFYVNTKSCKTQYLRDSYSRRDSESRSSDRSYRRLSSSRS